MSVTEITQQNGRLTQLCFLIYRVRINYRRILQNRIFTGDRGSTVVKVLFYKSEGRWFDPSLVSVDFSLT